MRSITDRRGRRIQGFRVIDVSTEDGWIEGRRQRQEWGRDRSAVVALDLDRVLIVLYAPDASEAAA
jgi:hypothetical protein